MLLLYHGFVSGVKCRVERKQGAVQEDHPGPHPTREDHPHPHHNKEDHPHPRLSHNTQKYS